MRRALCHQIAGKLKGFLALPHLLRLQTNQFIHWMGLKQRTSKKQMQGLQLLPQTVEQTWRCALFCLVSLPTCIAGMQQSQQKKRLPRCWYMGQVSLLISISRRNEMEAIPRVIFHWTQRSSGWAKGNQSDLTTLRQPGTAFAQEIETSTARFATRAYAPAARC